MLVRLFTTHTFTLIHMAGFYTFVMIFQLEEEQSTIQQESLGQAKFEQGGLLLYRTLHCAGTGQAQNITFDGLTYLCLKTPVIG